MARAGKPPEIQKPPSTRTCYGLRLAACQRGMRCFPREAQSVQTVYRRCVVEDTQYDHWRDKIYGDRYLRKVQRRRVGLPSWAFTFIPRQFRTAVLLAGPIPPELGTLATLKALVRELQASKELTPPMWLRRCFSRSRKNHPRANIVFVLLLAGPILPELGNLAALTILFMTDNQLSAVSLVFI